MSGPVSLLSSESMSGCVSVHTHTKTSKYSQLFSRPMELTLSQITKAYETFPIEASSGRWQQPLTKTYRKRAGKGMFPSVFMNEQPVLLSYTSPSCSAFGLVRFKGLCFFFSSPSFTEVFIGYSKTYMHAGRCLVSWNNRRGSQRCCLRQALAVRDTSICLCTHTGESHSSQKWAEHILNIM